jgi:restriction endonuclease S subunit
VVFTDNVKLRYKLNIDQNIALLRLAKGMVPEYVAIAILTRFVQTQIQRFIAGVGAPTIDFAEIRSLLVPIMDKEIQQSISKLYRLISSFHNDAMEAKATSKVGEAIRNLQIAEGMLETLIWQVEKLIEGERERITPLLPEEASERFRNVLIEEYRRIGELHQQLEGERKRGRVLGIPMERYPEVAEEIERVLRFVEATLPEEERVE